MRKKWTQFAIAMGIAWPAATSLADDQLQIRMARVAIEKQDCSIASALLGKVSEKGKSEPFWIYYSALAKECEGDFYAALTLMKRYDEVVPNEAVVAAKIEELTYISKYGWQKSLCNTVKLVVADYQGGFAKLRGGRVGAGTTSEGNIEYSGRLDIPIILYGSSATGFRSSIYAHPQQIQKSSFSQAIYDNDKEALLPEVFEAYRSELIKCLGRDFAVRQYRRAGHVLDIWRAESSGTDKTYVYLLGQYKQPASGTYGPFINVGIRIGERQQWLE
ncbi:MAG: hypothetical protein IBJ17_15415 [Reyranella sp.]|nr:hypothetical protein [Reyranella sp.]